MAPPSVLRRVNGLDSFEAMSSAISAAGIELADKQVVAIIVCLEEKGFFLGVSDETDWQKFAQDWIDGKLDGKLNEGWLVDS